MILHAVFARFTRGMKNSIKPRVYRKIQVFSPFMSIYALFIPIFKAFFEMGHKWGINGLNHITHGISFCFFLM